MALVLVSISFFCLTTTNVRSRNDIHILQNTIRIVVVDLRQSVVLARCLVASVALFFTGCGYI